MSTPDAIGLAGFLAAVIAVAASGASFKPGAWYESLNRPSWRPPNWLFGPAWAILYAMIAAAGWLVWRRVGFGSALAVYGVQLLLNAGWSAVFFGLHRPGLALGEITLLWFSIVATIAMFAPIDPLAAELLLPYLAWVTFAGALNRSIWRMNRA